jgi:hypothetical protein
MNDHHKHQDGWLQNWIKDEFACNLNQMVLIKLKFY